MAQPTIFVPDSHFCPYSFLATKTPPPILSSRQKIEEERGFWEIKIPNKAIGFLTYKLVLFIPADKQTKWKTENNSATFASAAWFSKSSTKLLYILKCVPWITMIISHHEVFTIFWFIFSFIFHVLHYTERYLIGCTTAFPVWMFDIFLKWQH